MKTNSTFKLFRNLLLLVVGVMGFAVSGFAGTVSGYDNSGHSFYSPIEEKL